MTDPVCLAAKGGSLGFVDLVEAGAFFKGFKITELGDALSDGDEVGEGATEPTLVDIVLSAGLCGLLHCLLSLFFASNEEDLPSTTRDVGKELSRLGELLDRLGQIDNVD